MNISNKIIYTFFIVTCITIYSSAQNFNDVYRLSEPGIVIGARALGMGNAFTAISDDFMATMFNPAGLGLIKNPSIYGGMNYNSFNNRTGFFNRSTDFSNSNSKLGQLGVIIPVPTIQGSFVVALGYNQVKDFNGVMTFNGFNPNNNSYIQDLTDFNDDIAFKLALSYPLYDKNNNYIKDTTLINGRLNQRGSIQQNGALNNWLASASIEVEKDIFVGATINLYSGNFNKYKDYYEEDLDNNYPATLLLDPTEPKSADFKSFYLHDNLVWDISGFGLNIGGLMKLNDNINLAGNIKFAKSFTIKETYVVDAESFFGNNVKYSLPRAVNLKTEYEISTPPEYTVGVSYKRNNILVSGNVTFMDYSVAKFKSGFSSTVLHDKNGDINSLFRSVINLNAGAEYKIPSSKFTLRGGFMLMQSPFKGDPSEYDKKFVTAGIGIQLSNKIIVDGAYAYGWWKDYGDNYGSGLSRTFQDIKNQNFIVSVKVNY